MRFDDVEIGFEFSAGPYVVEKAEVIEFARKWDPQPIHLDEAAAERAGFGTLIACSAHMFAIYSKLAAAADRARPILGFVAGLGQEQKLVSVTRPGDVLMLNGTVVGKRVSSSDPSRGILQARTTLANQHGESVSIISAATLWAR